MKNRLLPLSHFLHGFYSLSLVYPVERGLWLLVPGLQLI